MFEWTMRPARVLAQAWKSAAAIFCDRTPQKQIVPAQGRGVPRRAGSRGASVIDEYRKTTLPGSARRSRRATERARGGGQARVSPQVAVASVCGRRCERRGGDDGQWFLEERSRRRDRRRLRRGGDDRA